MTQVDLLKIQLLATQLRGGKLDRLAYYSASLASQYASVALGLLLLALDGLMIWAGMQEPTKWSQALASVSHGLAMALGLWVTFATSAVLLFAFASLVARARRRRRRADALCDRILSLKWNVAHTTTVQSLAA